MRRLLERVGETVTLEILTKNGKLRVVAYPTLNGVQITAETTTGRRDSRFIQSGSLTRDTLCPYTDGGAEPKNATGVMTPSPE